MSAEIEDEIDEYDDGPDDRDGCDCLDAELDWEGTFHCWSCGHRWYATTEQMDAYWRAYDAAHRPPTWHERMDAVMDQLKSIARKIWPHRSARMAIDDEIPF